MRKKLKKIDGVRSRFAGVFVRYGNTTGWTGMVEKTILVKDVRFGDSQEILCSHLWFNLTKGFQALGELQEGDLIEFDARVKPYRKGYWGWDSWRAVENPPTWDYKLSHPTKIQKIEGSN